MVHSLRFENDLGEDKSFYGLVNRGYNHGKQLKSTTFQRILQNYMNLEHVSSVVCSKTKFFWYYWPYIDDVLSTRLTIFQDM